MTTVLIADDIEANRFLLQSILTSKGHRVTEAANGAEALSFALADPPGIIITDILMPVMDGFELCRRWRAEERLRDIPFVVYTATYLDTKHEELALNLGVDRYLSKPQDIETLNEVVEELIEEYKKRKRSTDTRPLEDEMALLKQYNKVLFEKLEQKISQLKNKITECQMAEEQIRVMNAQLEERVKERTAELVAANRQLESFSYSVSHDLRSPLRAITGFTALLEEHMRDSLDDEGRRLLSVITENASKMRQLIDELLEFSRSGRAELTKRQIDMNTMARSVFEQLVSREGRENAEFRAGDLPPAHADPILMRQVWTNLLSNALKFSSKKEKPVIEIGSRVEDGRVFYFVRDNGAGFDNKYAGKLFGVFQRLHDARDFPGVGVGLAIVRQIIIRHGGTVRLEGKSGEGAVFWFSV